MRKRFHGRQQRTTASLAVGLSAVALLAASMLALAPISSAMAEVPALTIATPAEGAELSSATPAFSGMTSDSSDEVVLSIYNEEGSVVQSLVTIPSLSSWSVEPSEALPDGTYTARATQEDLGEEGSSPTVTFTVDTTPPVVSLNQLVSPTNTSTPTLAGAAGTAKGDSSTVSVTIYDGTAVGGEIAQTGSAVASDGTWSFAAVPLADGTYTAQATQTDEAGNVGRSTPVTFTVDTTAPSVSLNAPASPTDQPMPTLTGTGGIAEGDQPTVAVVIYHGAAVGGLEAASGSAAVNPQTGSWSYTPSVKLADGTYTAEASQLDDAGNIGASAPVTFNVDTTPPAVSITSPTNGSTETNAKPTFKGVAGDASGDLGSVVLSIEREGGDEQTLTVPTTGSSWKIAGPGLQNGKYVARATQRDSAGNVGISAPVDFTVDAPGPAVTLAPVSAFINTPTPSFSGTATPAHTKPTIDVRIYAGDAAAGTPAVPEVQTNEVDGSWRTGPVAHLPDGTYTVQAEQDEQFGNPGFSETATFTVDTTAPRVAITTPSSGSSATGDSELLAGTAGTEAGDEPHVAVKLFTGSAAVAADEIQESKVPVSGGTWKDTAAELRPGVYTALAEQSDRAGNVGSSDPVRFTVAAPQSAPVATETQASATPATSAAPGPPVAAFKWFPALPLPGETVSLVSDSTDAASPIVSYAWSLASTGAFDPGQSTLTTTFATPGSHVVRLQVTNAAGIASVASETIYVATAHPSLMEPFPVVRIAGADTARGVRLRLLTVQAPAQARITVTCKGVGCPSKGQTRVAGSTAAGGPALVGFPRFERALRAGVILEIRVSKSNEIGKYTRFVIRRHKLPERVDLCLQSNGTRPIVCPT